MELRSASDELENRQQKMQEYLENGLQLGWLIDPEMQQVEIYRPEKEVEVLYSPAALSGEEILPGLVLELRVILTE